MDEPNQVFLIFEVEEVQKNNDGPYFIQGLLIANHYSFGKNETKGETKAHLKKGKSSYVCLLHNYFCLLVTSLCLFGTLKYA